MRFACTHSTRYEYGFDVSFGPHLLYLRPREDARQRVSSFSLLVSPGADIYDTRDAYDNALTWAYIGQCASTLLIETSFQVETSTVPYHFILSGYAVSYPFNYEPVWTRALQLYLQMTDLGAQEILRQWSEQWMPRRWPQDTLSVLLSLAVGVRTALRYESRDLGSSHASTVTLSAGVGSCRDFALLLADLYRSLGFAARFVSGYLFAPLPGDFRFTGSMHAWTEVYLPGAGWVGFDPTHGCACDESYIAVAHSPHPDLVNPIQGSFEGFTSGTPELWMLVQMELQ
jgi:transglutaminase-like putative cysteine protease